MVGECWGCGGEGFPEEAVGDYVGGYAAVEAFDGVRPGEVFAQVGGEAFEVFEGVAGCEGCLLVDAEGFGIGFARGSWVFVNIYWTYR